MFQEGNRSPLSGLYDEIAVSLKPVGPVCDSGGDRRNIDIGLAEASDTALTNTYIDGPVHLTTCHAVASP